jgi:hypothetical protein
MSEYLNTLGNNTLAIGICARCSMKRAQDELQPDVNYPGLMVCGAQGSVNGHRSYSGTNGCADAYDPYRMPPRETEDIVLEYPRPDVHLTTVSVAPGAPVTVPPGGATWPPSQFPDDGLQANQQPPDGNYPFLPD